MAEEYHGMVLAVCVRAFDFEFLNCLELKMFGCVFLSHVSLGLPTGGTPRKAVTIVLWPKSLALHSTVQGGMLQ